MLETMGQLLANQYDKASIDAYLRHCRDKAATAVATASAESLAAPCGFQRRDFTRAELHVYTIRHVQHHAARLTLRLRLDTDEDIRWVGSGWRQG